MGQEFKNLLSVFFQKLIFFSDLFSSRALVTTWIACSTLQNINSSIRLAVNSLWKGLLCPNRQNNIDRKGRLECSYAKTTLLRPELIFNGRNFYGGGQRSKSIISEKRQKSQKKLSEITIFWKILTSVTSDISARYNTPTCGWSNCTTQKLKLFQKIASGYDFSQKSLFDPPPPPPQPAKSFLRSIFGGCGLVDFSFLH